MSSMTLNFIITVTGGKETENMKFKKKRNALKLSVDCRIRRTSMLQGFATQQDNHHWASNATGKPTLMTANRS